MRTVHFSKCPTCSQSWLLLIAIQDWLFNAKRCYAVIAQQELMVAVHRTDHVLSRLADEAIKNSEVFGE